MNEEYLYSRIDAQRKWLHQSSGLGLNGIITSIFYDKQYKMITLLSDDEKDKFRLGKSLLLKTKYDKKLIKKKLINKLSELLDQEEKSSCGLLKNLSIDELTEILLKYAGLVKDENGKWCHINKLNTNYSALSDMIIYLLRCMLDSKNSVDSKLASVVIKLIMMNDTTNALLRLKSRLRELIVTYIGITKFDYFKFEPKIKKTSDYGNNSENQASLLSELTIGTIVYQGGEGDFIDMIFGCDLIVLTKQNEYKTIQVKTYNVDGVSNVHINDKSLRIWVNDKCYSYNNIDILTVVMNAGSTITMYNIETTRRYNLPTSLPTIVPTVNVSILQN